MPSRSSDSGSTLLERINGVVPALVTNHKGPARPGYVQPGMMWIDDSGSEWQLNLYDGASDVAIAAIDPATHQALSQWVPETRTIASGLGVKINGGESATLAGTVTVGLDLATPTETIAGEIGNKPVAPDGVHAAIAAALAGFSAGGVKNIRLITASGNVTPSAGVTKWVAFFVDGGQGWGAMGAAGGMLTLRNGAAGGAGGIHVLSVNDGTSYPATIGASGGATSLSVGGVSKTTSNGAVAIPAAPGTQSYSPGVSYSGMSGSGGAGPFGLGAGGAGGSVNGGGQTGPGNPGVGYGSGAGGQAAASGTSSTAPAVLGGPGCILIWEF
ncbi:hypothetical protein ANOBCDAF_00189 [Pleomorphomonas sp. T1.2MG-36]|uniref:hypothetical protein n=1 Tax=Pleomorphomonas sp. T1.2MG-36 TaxID=3041167 RepID=UPI00247794C4|nr:hypothetical protein [Pleomorphomonas sp. T1.2MG-36]CAI9399039.1 hypothetical protein ANOBCDAF_00189 [Pleomorphomonas sp. T1.2MG-36]